MPSTFTTNLGIQKPADGEQDGVWGDVVNDNMDIIDRASNGQLTLMLTGTSSTLTTSNGIPSNGQYKMLVLSGTPSGTHTITILPNDAQKIYFVQNNTAQSVIFTQGSGGNTTILPSDSAIIYCDGAVLTARVQNLTDTLGMSSPNITGGTITGATISGIPDLAIADGGTGASTAADARTNLGLGTMATQADSAVAITGGTITGLTDLDVAGGSVGAPAYSFTGDTDTGMYRSAENTINFSLGGVQAMRLVEGFAVFPAATTEQKTIELGSGRTGNGFALIDLIGDATYTDYGTRLVRGSGGPNTTSILSHRGTGPLILEAVDAASITMETTNLERMRVTSAGLVGIGTTTPATNLDVVGSAHFSGIVVTGGSVEVGALGTGDRNALIDFHSSGTPGTLDYSTRMIRTPGVNGAFGISNLGTGNFNLGVNGVDRLIIFGSNARVYLNGSASRGTTGYPVTSPNDSVASALRAPGYIEWQTDAGAVGTNYFLSDERKKENIAPSVQSSADLINQIDFIQFDWKPESGNSGHVNVGVSAQQLQGIDSRLVHELSDGGLMVSEPALVAHIAKALQEALAKITALEARVAALET